jgi:hypothetical protein
MDSFRGEATTYIIDLEACSCTCPHWEGRLRDLPGLAECKHIAEVRRQAAWVEAEEKARGLSDADLTRLLTKHREDPLISGVLRVEREKRRERLDTDLKALFA